MTNNQTWQQIRLICSSGLPPLTVMPILSEALHEVLPCLSFTFILTDQHAKPLAYYAENMNEDTHKLFCEKGDVLTSAQGDPANFPYLFGLPNDYANLLNPPDEYFEGSVYTNFFAPNGIQHFIDMTVSHHDKPLVMIGIFREKVGRRSRKDAGFSSKEIATLPLLYSHIKHLSLSSSSLEVRDNLVDNANAKAFGLKVDEEVLDNNGLAEILSGCVSSRAVVNKSASITVNANGDVLFASDDAIELLTQGLVVKHRYLLNYQYNIQPIVRFLCQSLERKLQHSSHNPPVYHLSVPNGILVIRAYGMHALAKARGVPEYYTIHIELVQPLRLRTLYQLKNYKLSPKAMSVAWFISIGLDNTQVCERLSIKQSTLRSYLKVLYNRLNVNSHTQLKQKLISG